MRYHEICSAFRVPVSSEEQNILDMAGRDVLKKDGLDERQAEIARRMVSRGLLNRTQDGNFTVNSLSDLERD